MPLCHSCASTLVLLFFIYLFWCGQRDFGKVNSNSLLVGVDHLGNATSPRSNSNLPTYLYYLFALVGVEKATRQRLRQYQQSTVFCSRDYESSKAETIV